MGTLSPYAESVYNRKLRLDQVLFFWGQRSGMFVYGYVGILRIIQDWFSRNKITLEYLDHI